MLKNLTSLRLGGRVRLTFQRVVYPGEATFRTWYTVGLPVEVSLAWIAADPEYFYGPGGNRPALWKRAILAFVQGNGRSYLEYCPDRPPVCTGLAVTLLRYALHFGWATFRTAEQVAEHLRAPCEACAAAGWREDGNAP